MDLGNCIVDQKTNKNKEQRTLVSRVSCQRKNKIKVTKGTQGMPR